MDDADNVCYRRDLCLPLSLVLASFESNYSLVRFHLLGYVGYVLGRIRIV